MTTINYYYKLNNLWCFNFISLELLLLLWLLIRITARVNLYGALIEPSSIIMHVIRVGLASALSVRIHLGSVLSVWVVLGSILTKRVSVHVIGVIVQLLQ